MTRPVVSLPEGGELKICEFRKETRQPFLDRGLRW